MTTYTNEEYVEIIAKFDFDLINQLDPDDFVDFGVMDSKKYASKLFRIMDGQNLNRVEKTMVIVLATAVKNRKRVIKAMKKFSTKDWYGNVLAFFRNSTVQYTYEEEDDTFSVVHIPSCVPFLAARIWLQMTPMADCTMERFVRNLWAAQINLDDDLLARQREWEAVFWDEVVTKGGNNFERARFNRSYWDTKAADKYVLLNGLNWFIYRIFLLKSLHLPGKFEPFARFFIY